MWSKDRRGRGARRDSPRGLATHPRPAKVRRSSAGSQVPEPERAVVGAREGMAAVGGDRHRAHRRSRARSKECRSWPVARSQSLRVRSCEPERAWRPSGLTATALTGPSCPVEIGEIGW